MRRVRAFVAVLCCSLLIGAALAGDDTMPVAFNPATDEDPVRVTNPLDGSEWVAWTYRNGAESDIAVSRLVGKGQWSKPQLLGLADLEEQVQPALAVDGWGTVYLAWAERATGSVKLTAMRLGKQEWIRPVVVAAGDASSPALLVAAGRRLVVGYQQEGRVKLAEYRLLSPQVDPTANDGPDPLGYGKEEGGDDEDDQMIDEPVGDLFEIGVPRSQKEKGL